MPQITSVTSESLQATVRRLLPSQVGFGEDLQAQNVIVPIIDLTPTAEGSVLRSDLQSAFNLTDNTAFAANNSTEDIASTAGFWKIVCSCSLRIISATDSICGIQITDGVTTKNILRFAADAKADGGTVSYTQNLVVFLNSGDTLRAFSNNSANFLDGSARQIADISGNLINPTGYTGE